MELPKLTGSEPNWYKEAFRFTKNAGRKSKKRKAVRQALVIFLENGDIVNCKERIRATRPWRSLRMGIGYEGVGYRKRNKIGDPHSYSPWYLKIGHEYERKVNDDK